MNQDDFSERFSIELKENDEAVYFADKTTKKDIVI
jgi:hypothetical protein